MSDIELVIVLVFLLSYVVGASYWLGFKVGQDDE
jgi:hypothetical protein